MQNALFESVLHVFVQIVVIGIAPVIFAQLTVQSTNVTTLLSNALLSDCI